MTRRVPLRIARLLTIACACLLPAAVAQAAPPANDTPSGAQPITGLGWTSLTVTQDIIVGATDWGDATTGPEDSDPLPSCSGSPGFRSQWYYIDVPEASVLRVSVISTDPVRYQPVVNVIDPNRQEVGCGLANDVRQGATANATAYVTPNTDGTAARYLIRVAEVANNSPSAGLPMLTVRFAAQDVTPPHIKVTFPSRPVAPGELAVYDGSATFDLASQVNPASAQWEFHDQGPSGNELVHTMSGLRVTYGWHAPGAHDVVFRVKDFANNESMYKFSTLVLDTVRPQIGFSLRPPIPGARRLQIVLSSSKSVRIRLLVTQSGRPTPLLRRFLSFWGIGSHKRSVPLGGVVGRGLLVVSGVARDLAGNTTPLPLCMVDPVTGQGSCTS